ncbi:polyprenol monophosphomannose synthase [Helicobacter canis]|uniref:Glycosyltransferase 2-like domain-containing protein n=1 Tax=Helicobacter canis NCTC 12740 TaxID=1357399 RepID=V8CJ57_9HELI|nr:polyprenol monophosphomannose synthase [Helicobacter canis]ETD26786.1 hypothetical protein HMPREF2087_01176 [Helicobacter canis NCTC 12740]
MKNSTSNTAIPRILEEEKQASLRALAQDKAWQSIHFTHNKPAESKRHKLHTSTYSLHTFLESTFDKTQMDCHADFQSARNDRNNTTSKKVDSSAATSSSSRAAQSGVVIHSTNADSSLEAMDSKETSPNGERCPLFSKEATLCHDFASAKSRNDRNLDSTNATILNEPAKDSGILELESGFFKHVQGRILGVCNRSTRAEIHDSSPKAESTKETKTPKPLICIPTYNEAKNIAPLLREIFSLFPKIHILIIDDNSTDGTQEILASLSRSYPNLHILKRAGKLGLASAYIDGFSFGLERGFSHFIQMDADFSHHPRYLSQTLHNLSCFDVIINSRNIIGGGVVGWGLSRKILSRFGSLYARLWLGARVMDFTGGFNAYSARALGAINLHSIKSSGYCFQIEMKYRAYKAGLRLLELPIIFEDRIAGKSKMSKTIVLEALWRTPFLRLQATKATHKKVRK